MAQSGQKWRERKKFLGSKSYLLNLSAWVQEDNVGSSDKVYIQPLCLIDEPICFYSKSLANLA